MNPLWFIPAIMSVFGGVQDYKAGKEMESLAREQELMAEQNAALEQKELTENVRRENLRNAQIKGSALAKAAASGRRVEGSLSDYLSFIEEEQGREVDWMRSAGASRIRLNRQASLNQARGTRLQARAKKRGLVTGILGAASMVGAAGFFGGGGGGSTGGSVGATVSGGYK